MQLEYLFLDMYINKFWRRWLEQICVTKYVSSGRDYFQGWIQDDTYELIEEDTGVVSMLCTSGLSMIKCTKITFFHFLLRIRSLAS